MKLTKLPFILLVLALLSFLMIPTAAADDEDSQIWMVDTSRSTLTFTSEAPAEKIIGTTEEVQGRIQWNEQSPATSTGQILFPVSSMRTGNRLRDRHLQGDDWLGADANPNVTFELQGLRDVTQERDDDRINLKATAYGTVTLNGVTNEETAQITIAILPEQSVARIQPKLEFSLSDYEVQGTRGTIGREVGSTIEVEALIYANW